MLHRTAGTLVTEPRLRQPLGDDEGGDSVCWLHLLCPQCGALVDEDPPTACARCCKRIESRDDTST
jgi:hypothetical protein